MNAIVPRDTIEQIVFYRNALMEKLKAKWTDLPAGSFAEVGTNVNTCVVRFWADGRYVSHW